MTKNKIIISLFSVAFMFAGVISIAHADQQCGNPALNNASSTTQFIACSNGNPEMVTGGWGTKNNEVPHLHPGQFATDDAGISSQCPEYFMHDCVDITHTLYHIQQMKNLAAELLSKQLISQFLSMQSWVGK